MNNGERAGRLRRETMSKTTTLRYIVRPLGASFWAQCRTLAEARRELRKARVAGLRSVIIYDERTQTEVV